MAREFVQSSFYNQTSRVNSYYAAQIPIEYFIADTLMRHDLSRVVWASDSYAFRKRYELSDSASGEFGDVVPSSLNFPFVNYWYADGAWAPDDRPFSVQPSQILNGVWHEGLPAYLRAIAVKTVFTATAFFSRDDDARLAQEMLLWEQNPKGPIYLATKVDWHGVTLNLPVYITLDHPVFNPQNLTENDWLKSQRIFPIKFSFTARSYIILPEKQKMLNEVDSTDTTPPFMSLPYSQTDDPVVITENTILEFASAKNWGEIESGGSINPAVTDLLTGYFQSTSDLKINSCTIDPASIGRTSLTINWTFDPAQISKFAQVKILTPGQDTIFIETSATTSQQITNLSPSSQYTITLLFYSTSGAITTFRLSATTSEDPSNTAGTPLTKKKGKLRGMEW